MRRVLAVRQLNPLVLSRSVTLCQNLSSCASGCFSCVRPLHFALRIRTEARPQTFSRVTRPTARQILLPPVLGAPRARVSPIPRINQPTDSPCGRFREQAPGHRRTQLSSDSRSAKRRWASGLCRSIHRPSSKNSSRKPPASFSPFTVSIFFAMFLPHFHRTAWPQFLQTMSSDQTISCGFESGDRSTTAGISA